MTMQYYTQKSGPDLLTGPPDPEFRKASSEFVKRLSRQSRFTCLLHRLADRWVLPERLVASEGSVVNEVFARLENDYRWALAKGWHAKTALTYYKSPIFSVSFQLKFRSCEEHGWVILEQLVLRRWDGGYEIHRYRDDC
jgi:hypothetical protein